MSNNDKWISEVRDLNWIKTKQDQKVKNFGMVGMGYVCELWNYTQVIQEADRDKIAELELSLLAHRKSTAYLEDVENKLHDRVCEIKKLKALLLEAVPSLEYFACTSDEILDRKKAMKILEKLKEMGVKG